MMGRRHAPGARRFGVGIGIVLATLLIAAVAPDEQHHLTVPPAPTAQEGR